MSERSFFEWNCLRCGNTRNFSYRQTCRRCGAYKNITIGSYDTIANDIRQRPGDWHCAKCDKLQFARNKVCRDCGYNPNSNIKDVDLCPICMDDEAIVTLVHGSSGHCVCSDCAAKLQKTSPVKCPTCRQPVTSFIRTFR